MLKRSRLEAFWVNHLLNLTNLDDDSANVLPVNKLNGKTKLGIRKGGVEEENTCSNSHVITVILFSDREGQGDLPSPLINGSDLGITYN